MMIIILNKLMMCGWIYYRLHTLRLRVKRWSAKTRQPVLKSSLYRSVYISESHSRVADASVNIYWAG